MMRKACDSMSSFCTSRERQRAREGPFADPETARLRSGLVYATIAVDRVTNLTQVNHA